MQLIPAIDLLGTDAVRLEQGDFARVLFRYPLEEFVAAVVATAPSFVHVVDLQGARDGELREEIVARCVAAADPIPVQVSGGVRSVDAARRALARGAARVIVGTAAWSSPSSLDAFAYALGDRLVVALDVRDGEIATRGWTASSGLSVDDALARCREAGVVRVHVTAIDRDGTMGGPDLDLYRRVCASGLAVVAAGGVRHDADVEDLAACGCEAAVMGVGYLSRLDLPSPTT